MASRTKKKDEILELLKKADLKTIVLTGDSGVGKTWIAKEISDCAISKGLSYMTLWVFLNQQHEGMSLYHRRSLYKNIARQLSVLSTFEEWDDNVSKEEEQDEENLDILKGKISEKLKAMESAMKRENKFLLLILDGIPGTMNEDDIMLELQLNLGNLCKVLITRRKELVKEAIVREEMNQVSEIESMEMIEVIEIIDPLPEEERLTLLRKRVSEKVKKIAGFEKCAREIVNKSKGLPATIVVIAEALNRIGEHDSGSPTILQGALEEAAACEEAADGADPLLRYEFDMLPRTDTALINCCWHSLHFFLEHGGVHYNELIAYWVLEGYIDPVDLVEEAYNEGHRILIELIDRNMLKIQDGNVVVMEGLALTVPDYRPDGYEGTSSLGLESVFEDGHWQGLGKITPADGMIKTLCNPERWDKVSTLLIDGSRLCREVPDKFFEPILQQLQVLAIFNPSFSKLPPSLSKMGDLRLLVLRGCDPLDNIDSIKEVKSLTVLEISGATSLKKIDDCFFNKLNQLRSLKLSACQIKSLPPISHLRELRWLILSGCSSLEELPKIRTLTNLQVIDLSGATELETFVDVALKSLVKLRILDVSKTKLGRLPILGSLENLTRLSSKNDLKILDLSQTSISRLPSNFNCLSKLECLDLSDARNLVKMEDNCFQHLSYLRHLDLSNTKIGNLPSISNLGKLEVLNLSGCNALTKIAENSFECMTRLQRLNLSETKIECLPSLSKLVNLRHLDLSLNTKIENLPSLSNLGKLEVLNLSGCSGLTKTGQNSFEHMTRLQLLNLSETKIECLPSLSKLVNLRQLLIRNCVSLKELPPLESLSKLEELDLCGAHLSEPNLGDHTKLEVLDLSETKITSLPSLRNLSSLRELKLRDCSSLKQLPDLKSLTHLEVLDLWGTGIDGFPYEISKLTRLKHLDLPNLEGIQVLDWGRIKHVPKELNWVQCGIFKHSQNRPCMLLSGTELFKLLKKNPALWETCFKEFQFSVYPLTKQGGAGDIYWHRTDPFWRNIYLKTFSLPEEDCKFLEIVGFDSFPDDVEEALVKAEYISLIDNKFIKSLSDLAAGLKAMHERMMTMKGCMLEKCTEMVTIFGGEEIEVKMRENLKTLRASNLPKLKSVVSIGNVQLGDFQKLTELYLDCCPVLEVVFPSSQQPENLEILQIKFCDKLKTLFNSEPLTECKLQKLRKLHLLELPVLTSIGGFQNLRELYLEYCPELEVVFHLSQLAEKLEILKIKCYDKLKTLFHSDPLPECKPPVSTSVGGFQNLRELYLECFPELEVVSHSSRLPEKLEILQIKCCDKLKTLFHSDPPPECKPPVSTSIGGFQNLRELYLECCPKLEVVFHSFQLAEKLEILKIKCCDKLKTLFHSDTPPECEMPVSTSIGGFQNLRELYLECCPELEVVFHSSQMSEKLEILKIKCCHKLTLFHSDPPPECKPPVSTSIGGFQNLRELYLDCLPELEVVFHSSQLPEKLEILEIKCCDKLNTLFHSGPQTRLQNLRRLHLVELPVLTSIGVPGSKSIVDIFPSLKSTKVSKCPKLDNLDKIAKLSLRLA